MTQKRSTKRAFWMSALSLLLCVSMLVGTTYAWFTDSVVSGMNEIIAGNLDVALLADGKEVGSETKLFDDVTLWEPGAVVYENLQVVNKGSLALQYQMALNFKDENELEGHKLSEVLKVAIIDKIETKDRATVLAAAKAAKAISLYDFFVAGSLEANAKAEEQGVVIFWEPGENDNLYNANNGKTTSNGNPLGITFGIKLVATQVVSEKDSFGNEYDENAGAEFFDGFQGGTVGVAVKTDDQGLTTAEVAQAGGDVAVRIPAGVKVKGGVSTLKLSVTSKDHADANVQLNENEEMRPLDVHIEGVAEGNTVPMLITLKHYLSTGINTGALRLYHVENGTPVAMTQVATPTAHNEFSYDPATGDLVLAMASFSEVAVALDNDNTWDGITEKAYTGSGTEADPYLIYSADQLAYFRTKVDEGNTFAGKYVKLANNITLSGKNFDPIGWGYDYATWNRDGVAGKPFKGTFDGNGKIIFDLYQQGWELEEANGTDYTYTNCGFGLFASASDATFQNLTISGADIKTECVEMGVLVGLSQNNCTYNKINIYNSKIANYQRPAGGLIGEVSGNGTTKITNVVIGSDVVVGSLWGDFDAPCGGVIGARWDDVGADPQIVMKNVEVSCRLDVYNDITSAYQWHAYRRAGMLIGNTDTPAANGKTAQTATADFLECENVKAYLGSWSNYTYCQFSNEQNPGRNYPWVRVQAGENNPAYSNPRYGHPMDINGNPVTSDHDKTIHLNDDEHELVRNFGQLYGGGQGVYGATKHPGAELINLRYTITYMNGDEVLELVYVTQDGAVSTANDEAKKRVEAWATKEFGAGNFVFGGWMNAGSTALTQIDADNDKNIVLYPFFNEPYTASFVDLQGNVLAQCYFYKSQKLGDLDATKAEAEALLPEADVDTSLSHWEVHYNGKTETFNKDNFKSYTKNVTVYPVYTYDGKLNLMPHDTNGDGMTDHYTVESASGLKGDVMVPGKVNGIPVTVITDLSSDWLNTQVTSIEIKEGVQEISSSAFAMTSGLKKVVIPKTVTKVGSTAFGSWLGGTLIKKNVTIEYDGTWEQWKTICQNNWDTGLGGGSKVICTDGTYELNAGYLAFDHDWNDWKKTN